MVGQKNLIDLIDQLWPISQDIQILVFDGASLKNVSSENDLFWKSDTTFTVYMNLTSI